MSIRNFLMKVRPVTLVLGFGGAVLVLISALALDKAFGKDVLIVSPHDPSVVQLNKSLYIPGDPVAEIYGNPMTEPVRIVLPQKDKLIRPRENPNLLLLRVNKMLGENPLQVQTVWYFTRFALPAFLVLGIVGLILPRPKLSREGVSRKRVKNNV